MRRSVPFALAALAGALLAGPPPVSAQEAPPEVREWYQARGNAHHDGHSPFAPLRAEPAIAWQQELPGPLAGEPVTWGGMVYVPFTDGGYVHMNVYHARTGDKVATRRLDKGDWADLATWQGTVIVVQEGSMRGFPLKDGSLGNGWRKKGDFLGAPTVAEGVVLIRDATEIAMFDARTGRGLGSADWVPRGEKVEEHDAYAMLAVRHLGDDYVVAGAHRTKADKMLRIHVLQIEDLGGRKPKFGPLVVHETVPISAPPGETDLRRLIFGWIGETDEGSWLLTSMAKSGWSGTLAVHPTEARYRKASDIRTPPGATGGSTYGFALDSTLHKLGADREGEPLTKRGTLPQGARPSPAAAADGVLMFGNWAMDVETGRTLWVNADLPEAVSVIPIADAHVLLSTTENELICLADPAAIAPQGAVADAPGAESAPPPPADGDGVLLADGRKLMGTFDLDGDDVVVKTEDGKTEKVAKDDIALGEESGNVVLRGEEPRVLAAWQNILDGVFVRGLTASFEAYRKERLVSDCRRVLADLRKYGASNKLLEEYDASLVGMAEHPNADMKKKRLGPDEDAARAAALETVDTAVAWCEKREYGGAATALLDYSLGEGVPESEIVARATRLLPAGFPWADKPNAGLLWVRWARQMVPAGGEFLAKSNSLWNRARGKPWDEDTLGFRTKNTVLFTRCHDLDIVGMCLRVSEGTVRALEGMLGGTGSSHALDVRLHRNREEYLAEKTPSGQAMAWSAGYYSPGEGVSRFFVPGDGGVQPVSLDLSKTLAHELTHHWLSERWLGQGNNGRASIVPGYWIVEGFARFVEDQAVEMGRRAGKMDDATVTSLDAASQVAKQNKLMDTAELVAMKQLDFAKIPEKHVADVYLRNSTGNRRLDVRALFYEQSGSLVFFLANRCGEETRQALIDYMRSHYRGNSPADPSKALGFEDGADMHAKFEKFLLSLLE